ncbi:MAG: hypothetical protein L6416_09480 [Candidatus Omnitrophica bacterium]|nr:hypothetical protein [Candidatus Omnitrophota bacterium]
MVKRIIIVLLMFIAFFSLSQTLLPKITRLKKTLRLLLTIFTEISVVLPAAI